jgi:LPXTG-motif cell wall-anchored protein
MHRSIKTISGIVTAIIMATNLYAQSTFETVVPREPVISGESFRIQYVVKNATKVEQFKAPIIKNFRIVSGPDIYKGSVVGKNGLEYMTNIIFTLVALEEGRYLVGGATARIDGGLKKSNDAFINVTTKEAKSLSGKNVEIDSFPSDFNVGTDENVMEKIRRNLFLRVSVNKKTSFVGEPVVAEFKLYSRLESRSEIIKNPGFYGFGVHDIIGLGDKVSTTEMIDGKPFDVHTVRKVQLYALQPGNFTIDAMELDNRVAFNMQNLEKNNQEIVENMYGDQLNMGKDDFIETFEMALRTPPVEIKIKPLPTEGVTPNFNGAVGKFNITGKIDKDNLQKNQEGKLVITIRGAGNISQIGAPQVKWPVELENFEPAAQENFDRHQVPLVGTKTFEFPFVGNKPGDYIIPPVEFTFYNINRGRYETIQTLPFSIKITNERFGGAFSEANKNPGNKTSPGTLQNWLLVISGLVLLSLLVFFLFKRKKSIPAVREPAAETHLSIADILKPAKETMERNDPVFYNKLKDATWIYLSDRLGITGSNQNKEILKSTMEEKGADPVLINDILELLKQCELHIYTGAASTNDETFLFSQVETFMYKCDRLLDQA